MYTTKRYIYVKLRSDLSIKPGIKPAKQRLAFISSPSLNYDKVIKLDAVACA